MRGRQEYLSAEEMLDTNTKQGNPGGGDRQRHRTIMWRAGWALTAQEFENVSIQVSLPTTIAIYTWLSKKTVPQIERPGTPYAEKLIL